MDAYVALSRESYEEALASLKEHLQRHSEDYDGLILIGDAYAGMWEIEMARDRYEAAFRTAPNRPEYYNRVASLEIQDEEEGDYDTARKYLYRAIEMDPFNPEHYVLRAEVALKPEDSLKDYQKALELNPDYDRAFVARASHYQWVLKDNAKAIADMDRAIKANPLPQYYQQRAYIKYENKDYDKAFDDIDRAIASHDIDEYGYLSTKVSFHTYLREFDKALLVYDRMLVVGQKDTNAYCYQGRGEIYYELGEDDKAVAEFTKSTKTGYVAEHGYYCLAIVHASSGDRRSALEALAQATSLSDVYSDKSWKDPIMALLDGGPRYEFFPDDTEEGVLYDEPKKLGGALIALGWIGVLANLAVSIWFMRKVTRASARAATAIDLTEVAEVTEVTEIAEVVEVTEAPEVAEVSEATRTMDAKELEQRWAGTMEEAAAHNDPNVGWCRIIEQYRDFGQDERAVAEPVILKWTISIDPAKRFVALALVEICGMRTALPQLGRLEAYLAGREGPESRDELEKVRRIIEKLNKMC